MTVVSETHGRTLAKTVAYRILSVIITMLMTMAFGGSGGQMVAFGIAAFVIGSTTYYLHDRVWLRFGWNRDEVGVDSTKRSIIKTIVYRIIILVCTFITAKIIFSGDSNGTNQMAATFAIAMMVANALGYFVLEKVSNYINWGKKLTT
jgi:uncharacterized membrane protein